MTEMSAYYYHSGIDSIEPFGDREKAALFRRALERLRDQHSAPARPGPCIICSIVYGTLAEADRRARQHDH